MSWFGSNNKNEKESHHSKKEPEVPPPPKYEEQIDGGQQALREQLELIRKEQDEGIDILISTCIKALRACVKEKPEARDYTLYMVNDKASEKFRTKFFQLLKSIYPKVQLQYFHNCVCFYGIE